MPYENEHSCRLQDPKKYKRFARKTCDQKYEGKCIDVIYGIKDVKASAEKAVLHAMLWLFQRVYDTGDCAFVDGRIYQAIKPNRGKRPPNANYWKLVSEIQALRFATKIWKAADARAVCKDRKGTFEPAKPKKKQTEQSAKTAPQTACSFGEDCQVSFTAAETEPRKLKIIAYSGKIIPKHWYWGNVAFDLKGCRFDKAKTPILEEHVRDVHIGFSEFQDVTDKVIIEGNFLSNTRAQTLQQDMVEGFPMQASVFIKPQEVEFLKEEKDKAEVNGQTIKGPGAIFRKSVIREASLCTLGADKHTKAVIAAKENEEKVTFNVTEKEINIMEIEEMTAEQLTEERPDLAAEMMASGLDKGEKETRKLFNQFAEEFGDDPAFCLEQFKAGATVEEATAKQNEQLKTRNKELAEAAEKAKIDPAKQAFSDEQQEGADKDKDKDGKPTSWDAAIKLRMKEADCSEADAVRFCVSEYPKLHAKMLEEQREK